MFVYLCRTPVKAFMVHVQLTSEQERPGLPHRLLGEPLEAEFRPVIHHLTLQRVEGMVDDVGQAGRDR